MSKIKLGDKINIIGSSGIQATCIEFDVDKNVMTVAYPTYSKIGAFVGGFLGKNRINLGYSCGYSQISNIEKYIGSAFRYFRISEENKTFTLCDKDQYIRCRKIK